MWQGYICARCLEGPWSALPRGVPGAVPGVRLPDDAELQRKLLERDFLGDDPTVVAGFPLERELEYLERKHHKPKGLMTVPKELKK